MILQAAPGAENAVPVTLTEVAFEGNFITVHAVTDNGTVMTAELRNDGAATVPATGSNMHMAFDAKNSSILPDSATSAGV